jgi:hypothetical protein
MTRRMANKRKETDKPSKIAERAIPVSSVSFSPQLFANNTLVHIACLLTGIQV